MTEYRNKRFTRPAVVWVDSEIDGESSGLFPVRIPFCASEALMVGALCLGPYGSLYAREQAM
jgi:hypothetical protein